MKHISKKEFVDLMLGLPDEKKRNSYAKHIAECPDCGILYKKTLSLLTPCAKDEVIATEKLKKRILRGAALLREKENNLPLKNTFYQRIKNHTAVYASAAASLLIIIVSGAILLHDSSPRNVYLEVSRLYGKAKINASRALVYDTVSAGNIISTDENSSMMLSFSRDYKLMIMGKSFLTIDKADLNAKRDLEVRYTLDRGTLLSRHIHNDRSVSYAFVTPDALINAENAELMIHASDNESSIFLIKGKLEVQGKNSTSKTTIDSPGRYIISNGRNIRRAEDPAINDIQNVDEDMNMHDDEAIMSHNYFNQNQVCDDPVKDTENERLLNTLKNIISDSAGSSDAGASQ